MANVSNVIFRAMVDGVLTDLMGKTIGDVIYLSDGSTLTAKIAEIVVALNERAKSADVTDEISTAVSGLKTEIMGGNVPEALDTFKELADYLDQHQDAFEALQAAIGDKADATTVELIQKTVNALGSLATKSVVSESDLDTALQTKISNAAAGNHSHANKAALDKVTDEKINAWDAKGTVYVSKTQPSGLKAGDLWAQLI